MSSPLETLPTELLDNILVWLTDGALVNLWKTNTRMSCRLDNHLFGHLSALNHMKKWACKRDDAELLRAIVTRDGDPNFVLETLTLDDANSLSDIGDWSLLQLYPKSTLRIVIERGRPKTLDALLEMGATFEVLSVRDRKRISDELLSRIDEMSPEMIQVLTRAKLGSWVLDIKGAIRTPMDFIQAGTPVNILRSIIQGRNLDCVSDRHWELAWSPLSAAIELGKADIVNMLIENGASINGIVKRQPIDSTAIQHYYPSERTNKRTQIEYRRPLDMPIFAAAKHMATRGSTEMLDLCLRHGADINTRSPASRRYNSRVDHFTTTPLMTYLECIPSFPVQTGLDPVAGIKYFISNGAEVQRNEAVDRWYFGQTTWLNVSSLDQCVPLSMVEVLLYKWNLEKLHEPQFLDTIKYLIAQGSGIGRADNIVLNFSFDSIVTSFPLPQSHADHPDNVPKWWDVVQRVWDKLDEEHGHSYAWMQHSLALESEAKNLITTGIRTQEERDRLLFTSFIDMKCLYFPQHYGTLPRLMIDRQIDLGADINAAVGEKGETLLFYVCDQINNAFVRGETDAIDSDYQHPENANVFHVKLQELVLSLVNKGADPRTPVNDWTSIYDDWTPYHVLKRDINKTTSRSRKFLINLVSEIEKARDEFLMNGSTDSVLIKRTDVLDLGSSKDDSKDAKYSPAQRLDSWDESEVVDIRDFFF